MNTRTCFKTALIVCGVCLFVYIGFLSFVAREGAKRKEIVYSEEALNNLEQLRKELEEERANLQRERDSLQQERKKLQQERASFENQRLHSNLDPKTYPQPNTREEINPNKHEVAIEATKYLLPFMYNNRAVLSSVPRWIEDSVYQNSIYHYGISTVVYNLVDKPVGGKPTHSDVLAYLGNKYFKGPKTFLEIGASVGKNIYQMLNSFENSVLCACELENINPTLERLVENKLEIAVWPTLKNSPRKAESSLSAYYHPSSGNTLYYLTSDIYDAYSWEHLAENLKKFDIIVSDGVHHPEALLQEIDWLLALDLINPERFLIWYDDLGGDMTAVFFDIARRIQARMPALADANVALVRLGGWLGENEFRHLNGIVTSLDITRIIEQELVLDGGMVPRSGGAAP